MHAEDVAQLDRAHDRAAASAVRSSARAPKRVAATTSTTRDHGIRSDGRREQRRVEHESQRRLGSCCRGRDRHEREHECRENRAGCDSTREPEQRDEQCAQPQVAAKRCRRARLALRGRRARRARRGDRRRHRAAGRRARAPVQARRSPRASRARRARADRRGGRQARQRARRRSAVPAAFAGSASAQSSFGGAEPGRVRVEHRLGRLPVGNDRVADDRRKRGTMPTIRAVTSSPSIASGTMWPSPAAAATSGVTSTGSGCPSVGCGARKTAVWSGVIPYASVFETPPLPIQPANAPRTGRPSTDGVPSRIRPRAVGCRPMPAFATRRPPFSRSSSSELSVAFANGMRPCRTTRSPPCVVPSDHRLEVAERRAEKGAHCNVVAMRGDREAEDGSGRQRRRPERARAERKPALGYAEEREARGARDVAGEPEHLRRPSVARPAVKHRHELREVLGCDVRRGNGVVRLVVLALQQGRAIGDREERQAEARDEEGRDDRRLPRVARERDGRKPQRQRAASADSAERPQCRQQQADGADRRGERDERRHEQDERPRSLAVSERARVDRAARIARDDDRDRGERCDVERRHREAAGLERACAHRQVEEQALPLRLRPLPSRSRRR